MSCKDCRHYAAFEVPRDFGEYKIYGLCYKQVAHRKKYITGYPVYIPDGQCKDIMPIQRKKKEEGADG